MRRLVMLLAACALGSTQGLSGTLPPQTGATSGAHATNIEPPDPCLRYRSAVERTRCEALLHNPKPQLNPQPLPPGFRLNPQPLPPG